MHGQIVVTDTRLCDYLSVFVTRKCCFSCNRLVNLRCDLPNGWNIVIIVDEFVFPGLHYKLMDIGCRCSKYERRSL